MSNTMYFIKDTTVNKMVKHGNNTRSHVTLTDFWEDAIQCRTPLAAAQALTQLGNNPKYAIFSREITYKDTRVEEIPTYKRGEPLPSGIKMDDSLIGLEIIIDFSGMGAEEFAIYGGTHGSRAIIKSVHTNGNKETRIKVSTIPYLPFDASMDMYLKRTEMRLA